MVFHNKFFPFAHPLPKKNWLRSWWSASGCGIEGGCHQLKLNAVASPERGEIFIKIRNKLSIFKHLPLLAYQVYL